MNLSNVISRIIGRQTERQTARMQTYAELVASVASGTEPSDEEIESVLLGAGRTANDLLQDVELYINRRKWAAQLEELEPAKNAVHQADIEMKRIRAEYDESCKAAFAKHHDEMEIAKANLSRAQAKISQANDAAAKLMQTAPGFARMNELTNANIAKNYQAVLLDIDRKSFGSSKAFQHDIDQLQVEIDANAPELEQLNADAFRP